MLNIQQQRQTIINLLGSQDNRDNRKSLHLYDIVTKQQIMNKLLQTIANEQKTFEEIIVIILPLLNLYQFLKQQILKMNFFQNFFKKISQNVDVVYKVCSKLKLESFQKGNIILKQGDRSNDKMYVIAFGQVCVCVKDHENEETDNALNHLYLNLNKKKNKLIQQHFETYGYPITALNSGEGFGELALLNNSDQKRMATIIALRETQLIILNKEDYLLSLQNDSTSLRKEQFLQQFFPFIAALNSQHLKQYFFINSFEKDFVKGRRIFEEDSYGTCVFLIMTGTVKLTKQIQIQNPIKEQFKEIQICEIGDNNILGEEILFNKDQIYQHTATVTSFTAQILQLEANLFAKFPKDIIDKISDQYKNRKQSRHDFLKYILSQAAFEINQNLETFDSQLLTNKSKLREKELRESEIKIQFKDDIKKKLAQSIKQEYSRKKQQKLLIEHKTLERQNYARQNYKKDKSKRGLFNNELTNLYQLCDESKRRSIKTRQFETLIGTEQSLINNPITNRFFKISNQKMNDNSIELSSISNTSIESLIIGEEILDFGYLEEFNRNKEFMLIQKGVVKRKKEIRDLYEVMNECQQSQSLPKLKNKAVERPLKQQKKAYFNLSIKQQDKSEQKLSNSVFNDPYSMQEAGYESLGSERKLKVLHRKLKRIQVVNSRIKNAYESLIHSK